MADVEKVPFKRKQVKLAVAALLAYLKQESTQKRKKDELFESEDILWLLLGLKKVPTTEKKPRKIPLPHPFNSEAEVCLITKEPGKVVKKKLLELGITSIKKVISLTKLRKEHKTFVLKRQLCASYDVFLCDDRIYHLVIKTLGGAFFKRRKEPLPVRLTCNDWKLEISRTLSCSLLRLGHGPCSAIKVGSISLQSGKELTENTIHLMKVIGGRIPGGWKNVKGFHVKSSTSVALPVYQSSPLTDIPMEKLSGSDKMIEGKKDNEEDTAEKQVSEEENTKENVSVPDQSDMGDRKLKRKPNKALNKDGATKKLKKVSRKNKVKTSMSVMAK